MTIFAEKSTMHKEIQQESIKYIDLVYSTLERWYQRFAAFTPNLVVGVLIFLLFLYSSRFLSRVSVRVFHKFFPKSEKYETVATTVNIFRFLIMLIGTFISLEIMGLSGFLWKFIGSLGVAGVIAGVALKDLVSSIFSGMLVNVDKAFKAGDYITISNYSGTVQEIGFLTTKLITDDGKKVYIPNQVIFNAPFFNITASPQRRIILDFQIPVGEDLPKVYQAVLDEIKQLQHVDKTDTAQAIFTDVKNGNFILQVQFWLTTGANYLTARSAAIMQINKRLSDEGINLVTPTSISISPANLPEQTNP